MESGTADQPARGQRAAPVPENSRFIRRREDSKRWFRNETGTLERNIRWAEVGNDAYSPTEFPAVKPKKNAMSTWDEAQWPAQTRYPVGKIIRKSPGKEKFMLTDNDIIDLCYRDGSTFIARVKQVPTKEYLCSQFEHRAWEKFGGPEGLKKARELRDEKRARRAAATSTETLTQAQPTVRAAPFTRKKAPSSLLHLLDEIDVDSGSESEQSSSPSLTPGAKHSPIYIDIPDDSDEDSSGGFSESPLQHKSLGFLDLTLSDSEDEKEMTPGPPGVKRELEVIELSD